ncbi:unnamed protein product [Medioppia subpectinata]|uniref:Uncharacterized protein n=1 Tax=Medioppia subpectinata TaxID=1979941 RepID=A0A7R9KN22_9ACAR|nr:unnamed protein product [Medioppia subpectinata]CAG2105306.1 unnamed protein product [Medioppia subpectinata]
MSGMGWQSQSAPGAQCPSHQQSGPPGAQQQLSVVTTVWGVKTSNQNGPTMGYTHGAGNGQPNNGPTGGPYGGQTGHDGYSSCPTTPMPPQKSYQTQTMSQRGPGPGYAGRKRKQQNASPTDHFHRYGPQATATAMSAGMQGSMPTSQPNSNGDFQGGQQAINTAALVAAATATATATASVVAMQERQQEVMINSQYGQMQGMHGQSYGSNSYGPQTNQRMSSCPPNAINGPMVGHMNSMSSQMHNPNMMGGGAGNGMSPSMSMNGPMGMNKGMSNGSMGAVGGGGPMPGAGVPPGGAGII